MTVSLSSRMIGGGSDMARQIVMSIGVGQKYGLGLKRLSESLDANEFLDSKVILREYMEDCPSHQQIPYGFKPWSMNWAREEGYDQAFWMDSACVVVKPLDPLWRRLEKQGHIFQYSPNRTWEWCSDACAEKMGISQAKLSGLCPSLWACVMGMDFRNDRTNEFLDKWLAYSRDGVCFYGDFTNENGQVSSNPRVKGHRHDQTVACILSFELGMSFDEDVVRYDHANTVTLENYPSGLKQPNSSHFVLAQHDVKTRAHAE